MQDNEEHSLWELTWHRARAVSSGLTPTLLHSAGMGPSPGAPAATSAAPHDALPPLSDSAVHAESSAAVAESSAPTGLPEAPQESDNVSRDAIPRMEAGEAAVQSLPEQGALNEGRQADQSLERPGADTAGEF